MELNTGTLHRTSPKYRALVQEAQGEMQSFFSLNMLTHVPYMGDVQYEDNDLRFMCTHMKQVANNYLRWQYWHQSSLR